MHGAMGVSTLPSARLVDWSHGPFAERSTTSVATRGSSRVMVSATARSVSSVPRRGRASSGLM